MDTVSACVIHFSTRATNFQTISTTDYVVNNSHTKVPAKIICSYCFILVVNEAMFGGVCMSAV